MQTPTTTFVVLFVHRHNVLLELCFSPGKWGIKIFARNFAHSDAGDMMMVASFARGFAVFVFGFEDIRAAHISWIVLYFVNAAAFVKRVDCVWDRGPQSATHQDDEWLTRRILFTIVFHTCFLCGCVCSAKHLWQHPIQQTPSEWRSDRQTRFYAIVKEIWCANLAW